MQWIDFDCLFNFRIFQNSKHSQSLILKQSDSLVYDALWYDGNLIKFISFDDIHLKKEKALTSHPVLNGEKISRNPSVFISIMIINYGSNYRKSMTRDCDWFSLTLSIFIGNSVANPLYFFLKKKLHSRFNSYPFSKLTLRFQSRNV